MKTINVLILGASYGSLLGTKLALGGHNVKLVCLPAEADAINSGGVRVRMPIKGREGLTEVHSWKLPGKISADGPAAVNPGDYDLVALAMQEPQYRSPGVRELLDAVAKSRVPCMSIMNMPPLPYLARIPGISTKELRSCYTEPAVWDSFDPNFMTLCSPDPQAFRPPEEKVNVLQVRLPTNFKCARFPSDEHTAILKQLEADIEAARFDTGSGKIELPVKLKVHESVFVPLAKWAMLIAGNYRCVTKEGPRAIKDAVHSNLDTSRAVYQWVVNLCVLLGANEKDLVPFEKYAAAAQSLGSPSSAARFDTGSGKIELPVKLKVHESVFVPLAKWAMLIAGNYRCVTKEGPRAIKDAVHSNLDTSRAVYQWVVNLCVLLGVNEKDLVPFEKYAAAEQSLGSPSSAARALYAGAPNIERVDRLVQAIAKQKGMQLPILDEVVHLVDARLEVNRKKAA